MANETGFPSPAQGYEAQEIDLNRFLVSNQPATFYMRVVGDKLEYSGILEGDLLVVDRSLSAKQGSFIVFLREGEFVCRELIRGAAGSRFTLCLRSGEQDISTADINNVHKKISKKIQDENFLDREILDKETEIFGVVTAVVRKL